MDAKTLKVMLERIIDQNSMSIREILYSNDFSFFESLLGRYMELAKSQNPAMYLDGVLAGFGLSIVFRDILNEHLEHEKHRDYDSKG